MTCYLPVGSCHVPFFGRPISGLGIYNHKVGDPEDPRGGGASGFARTLDWPALKVRPGLFVGSRITYSRSQEVGI